MIVCIVVAVFKKTHIGSFSTLILVCIRDPVSIFPGCLSDMRDRFFCCVNRPVHGIAAVFRHCPLHRAACLVNRSATRHTVDLQRIGSVGIGILCSRFALISICHAKLRHCHSL